MSVMPAGGGGMDYSSIINGVMGLFGNVLGNSQSSGLIQNLIDQAYKNQDNLRRDSTVMTQQSLARGDADYDRIKTDAMNFFDMLTGKTDKIGDDQTGFGKQLLETLMKSATGARDDAVGSLGNMYQTTKGDLEDRALRTHGDIMSATQPGIDASKQAYDTISHRGNGMLDELDALVHNTDAETKSARGAALAKATNPNQFSPALLASIMRSNARDSVTDAFRDPISAASTNAMRSGTSGFDVFDKLARDKARQQTEAENNAFTQGVTQGTDIGNANMATGTKAHTDLMSSLINANAVRNSGFNSVAGNLTSAAQGITGAGNARATGLGNLGQTALSAGTQLGSNTAGQLSDALIKAGGLAQTAGATGGNIASTGFSTKAGGVNAAGSTAGSILNTNASNLGANTRNSYTNLMNAIIQSYSNAWIPGMVQGAQQVGQNTKDSSGGFGDVISAVAPIALMALSSRDYKTKVGDVDTDQILEAVEKLPIDRWKYHGEDGTHIGTYAEDFNKAFDLDGGKAINLVDAVGVLMACVKSLSARVKELENG
jgi:hypothetical protein